MKKSVFLVLCTFIVWGLMAGTSPSITVTSPTSGQAVCKGGSLTITWDKDGTMDANVAIRLRQGGSKVLDITDSTTNDGSYTWTPVPGSLTTGSYFIRVRTVDGAVEDDSPNFNISDCPSSGTITVSTPTEGCKNQSLNITWTKTGTMDGNVKIRLRQGSSKVLDITDSTTNDGSYNWTVPGSLADGSYFIRIKTVDEAVEDDSGTFPIKVCSSTGDGPTLYSYRIVVVSPKATSKWQPGSTKPITWKRHFLFRTKFQPKWTPLAKVQLEKQQLKAVKLKGLLQLIKSVKIEYRRVACKLYPMKVRFALWKPLKSKAFDGKYGGTYNWPIPSNMKPGCYQIRVTENKTKGRSAKSKTFLIRFRLKLKPGIFKKKAAVAVLKEKG